MIAILGLEQPADRRQRATELYQAGLPLVRIADRLGVTERSVYRYLRSAEDLARRRLSGNCTDSE